MTFHQMFVRLIDVEGGYVNDPNDPGGETKYGISKRSYPTLDIKNLTLDDAEAIYLRDFWTRIAADKLPSSVAFQVFDFAVNSGIETAVRKLQAAIDVADDGYWGPVSAAAADAMSEATLILRLTAQRLRFWTKLKNWSSAGKGWINREATNLDYASLDITHPGDSQ
jgi:lysozyme family protein